MRANITRWKSTTQIKPKPGEEGRKDRKTGSMRRRRRRRQEIGRGLWGLPGQKLRRRWSVYSSFCMSLSERERRGKSALFCDMLQSTRPSWSHFCSVVHIRKFCENGRWYFVVTLTCRCGIVVKLLWREGNRIAIEINFWDRGLCNHAEFAVRWHCALALIGTSLVELWFMFQACSLAHNFGLDLEEIYFFKSFLYFKISLMIYFLIKPSLSFGHVWPHFYNYFASSIQILPNSYKTNCKGQTTSFLLS